MDFVNKLTGGNKQEDVTEQTGQSQQEGSAGSGGFIDKLNTAAGGGKESEKNEDAVDKGVDYVQQNVFGQGDQTNESALEQAKDEQISDFIRDKYKDATGKDVPIKDKS
ncbi:hypothetical protein B0T26DRAFT_711578 [Lasiosphaeria miniovina]|uniref:DNA damage-responsive protein 48 n=1 Tax=Lasiosphaeria miniovina TaxID=1954250 RepID=A0AA40DYV9_9PEZI|nr:uncharacterized protein B0T26DRAFT_711578 [Lasiosphaeria miniovina]KAK0718011.1 hypothetical protein B0T26DRAFT_711578 [Lasiosphaeria miniovina]